jgi:hypothetical protein
LPSGATYSAKRTLDGSSNPLEVTELATSTSYEGSLKDLFPILAYRQNEVIGISRNSDIQLLLIDKLVDVKPHNQAIDEVKSELRPNLNEYLESRAAFEEVQSIDVEIATKRTKIQELNRILEHPKFQERTVWDRQTLVIDQIENAAKLVANGIKKSIEPDSSAATLGLTDEDKKSAVISNFHAALIEGREKLSADIEIALQLFEETLEKSRMDQINPWNEKKESWEQEYAEFLQTVGGEQEGIDIQRTTLVGEEESLKQKRQEYASKADGFNRLSTARNQLLDRLDQAVQKRFDERSGAYVQLTEKNAGRLQLNLLPGANKSNFDHHLVELFGGMNIQQRYREQLVQSMVPREVVNFVLAKDSQSLITRGNLTETSAEKIVSGVNSNNDLLRKLLELPLECIPIDVQEILYKKEEKGDYFPLPQLSVGQKCTALLLIALSEGKMPIVIDQPEDALDAATVYKDVVQRLRSGKDERQFIITTHNSNVAVSSDSDKYHNLQSSSNAGELIASGSIDLDEISKHVIEQLEGGISAYQLRGRKYNVT